jgi:hypothetical protein
MRALLSRITYANLMATVAVFIALGGSAYAAATIGTSQIKNGAVTTPKITNGGVTTPKIKNAAVKSSKLAKGAVTGEKIGDGSIAALDLANGAVTSAKLAPGSLSSALFAAGQAPGVAPTKLSVHLRTASLPASQTGVIPVECPNGTNVLSGGYLAPGPVLPGDLGSVPFIRGSYPSPPTGSRGYTGWTVWASTSNVTGADITAYAVCVAP